MQLVDTNIAAYLLIEGDRNEEAAHLLRLDSEWHSEEFILVEFTNVITSCLRAHSLTLRQAEDTLESAYSVFGKNLHVMDHRKVLSVAVEYKVSAYDARFLAAAKYLGVRLITEDIKLRRAAPELTQSIREAIKNR